MNILIQKEIDLYKKGLSTYQIAKLLNRKPNTVRDTLNRLKIIIPSPGLQIEKLVAEWFVKKGCEVERKKGDFPYDLVINGEKIDIKSSKSPTNNGTYKFQLCDMKSRINPKDFSILDSFLLVFCDLDDKPMYKISASDISAKQTLSIRLNSTKSKHNLQFVGYLDKN